VGVAEEKAGTRRQLVARAFLPYAARKRSALNLGTLTRVWLGFPFSHLRHRPFPAPAICISSGIDGHRRPLVDSTQLLLLDPLVIAIAIATHLHIFARAGCSGLCGKLTGGSRASLSVVCSTLRTVPLVGPLGASQCLLCHVRNPLIDRRLILQQRLHYHHAGIR